MQFLINELSFVGQAENDFEADKLMMNLRYIIQEIKPIQGDRPIQTHSNFANRQLSPSLTVHQWLRNTLKSPNQPEKTVALAFLQIINKGPFIDLHGSLGPCECYFNKDDVSSSSLAGAAKLEGILLSLQKATDFESLYIEVSFRNDKNFLESKNIHNLTTSEQARRLRPIYKPNPKHDPQRPWQDATPMDLTDEETQKILDKSKKDNNENSQKRYSYHREKDRFYVFHSDNTYNERGYPTYHGYPIAENEVPSNIREKLKTR